MNPLLKNTLAILAGIVFGSVVNMAIIFLNHFIIAPPAGADITTIEGLKNSIHLFEPKHFIFPFIAHALGTFAGALVAAFFAVNHKLKFALIIGVFFLIGGVVNAIILPAPLWFIILDLAAAYIPMSILAGRIIIRT